jgi:hypothetical protein
MITLKQAKSDGSLDQFIADHDGDEGDETLFNATLQAMAGKLTIVQEASDEALNDD